MVKLGRVSRSSFYRLVEGKPARPDDDLEWRDTIQRIALEWPTYGRPRITAELRRKGWTVTDSNHWRKVYPNLAAGITPTGLDQLWVADITYVRLQEEFVFLAVILDAHSRRVIGWALDRTIEDDLTLTAWRWLAVTSDRAWCTIPTAAHSMPATTTPNC